MTKDFQTNLIGRTARLHTEGSESARGQFGSEATMPYAKFHDLPGEIVALRHDSDATSGGTYNPSGLVATLRYKDGRTWAWALAELLIDLD
jgi:hypothetical protein|tara:strand:+ start:437 stop:709 length:273 start_codon:yes stop_codon:yes gene_type:complete